MSKQIITISKSNVELLQELDNSIKEAQNVLSSQIEGYNNLVNSLNYKKQFLLKSLINQEDMGDVKRWILNEEYVLVEQTEEEYEELLTSNNSVVEHELDNVPTEEN